MKISKGLVSANICTNWQGFKPEKLNSNAKFKGKSRLQRGNKTTGQELGEHKSRTESDQQVSKMVPGNCSYSH